MFKSKKSLGQNFLISDIVLPQIIQVAEIKKGDVVIEVGPGLGILTQALLDAGANVFAIEKDFDLITKLQKNYKNTKNLTIIHQDALLFDIDEFSSRQARTIHSSQARTIYSSRERSDSRSFKSYKVVANLPFNIASPLIRKFLESKNQPKLMVVMIQKEVAEKIVAKPGNSERGILTLAVEFYADAEIITIVPKDNFKPQPKVDAAILKIIPYPKTHPRGGFQQVDEKAFFRIVKAGFSTKRRQIHNPLAATLHLDKNVILEFLRKAQINPELRAEDLSLGQWLKLYEIIQKGLS